VDEAADEEMVEEEGEAEEMVEEEGEAEEEEDASRGTRVLQNKL
jgi:hypothetical protein